MHNLGITRSLIGLLKVLRILGFWNLCRPGLGIDGGPSVGGIMTTKKIVAMA